MGGQGSGGGNRLSDEERKARGTFRSDRSDAERDAAKASKVVTGHWLPTIPPPTFPLNDVGKKKYDELTRILFAQNKLTIVTQMQAEMAARQFEKIYTITAAGKDPSASDMTELAKALGQLKIAEDAPPIANPEGRINKFASCGFSTRRNASVRVRGSSGSRS
jgi:hypothetical protein